MALLDLPPELFRQVITEYVTDVGVVNAWKQRGVCRTFKLYITEEVFGNQPVEAFTHPTGKKNRDKYLEGVKSNKLLREGMALYLEYQSSTPLGAKLPLPGLVRGAVDLILPTSGLPVNDLRREVAEVVVKYSGCAYQFVTKPSKAMLGQFASDSLKQNALCIAIGMNNPKLVDRLIVDGASVWHKTCAFNLPLDVAMATRSNVLVDMVLRYSQDDTSVPMAKRFKLLAEKIKRESWPRNANQLPRHRQQDFLKLIKWQLDHLGTPNWNHRSTYFQACVEFKDITLLKRILQQWGTTPDLENYRYPKTYYKLGRRPSLTITKLLLEEGIISMDECRGYSFRDGYDFGPCTIVNHAVRWGAISVARFALQAGASPNGAPYEGFGPIDPSGGSGAVTYGNIMCDPIWPLRIAVNPSRWTFDGNGWAKSLRMAKLLLKYGADPDCGNYADCRSPDKKCILELVQGRPAMLGVIVAAIRKKMNRLGKDYKPPVGHEHCYLKMLPDDMAKNLPNCVILND